jgi:peptide/nickel transport system permease protein
MRLLPSDPILLFLSQSQTEAISEEQLELLRSEYGLDKPVIEQYVNWISDLVRGDLGDSIINKRPVTSELLRRIPITLHIGLLAFILGVIIGIPAGVICAVRRASWIDLVVTTMANIGITLPTFWLALLLMYVLGLQLGWLPISGYSTGIENFGLNTRQIIMPVFCLAIFPIAGIARQTRSSMLEVMKQDYIRTALSKGLPERIVVIRHALKNGLIPIVTLSGLQLSHIIGGSVFIETVFVIPGMGSLLVNSVLNQDYPYVQGITFIIAVVVLLVNIIVDITYGYIDPRIRFS